MNVVSAARRAVPGEEVLAAGIFQAAGTLAARYSDFGEISARRRAREEREASGLAFRRYLMLVVTPTRLHVFDARSGFGWKAKRQLAVWPRAALRIGTEVKAVTIRLTIEVLAAAGGLVPAVGFFLPWLEVRGAQTHNLSGAQGGAPILSIGFSIAIIVVAVLYLYGRRETSPQLLRSLGFGSVIAAVFTFVYLSDQLGRLRSVLRARGALVTVSMGIGPWVQLAGAGIVLAVGIWAVRLERRRRPSRPRIYAPPPPPGRSAT